jgi:WhiB family transcriptional regulator, redox-sensing transcriptional regulator
MTDYATDWRAGGACLSADPDLFFPIASGQVATRQIMQAQRICAGCGVQQQCLDFAMQTGEVHGIWGGTTPEERIRTRRNLMRRRRARRSWQPHEAQGARAS